VHSIFGSDIVSSNHKRFIFENVKRYAPNFHRRVSGDWVIAMWFLVENLFSVYLPGKSVSSWVD